MQPISEQVTGALQAVLSLERQAFSQFHDEEHHEEARGNKKLTGWYNDQVSDARTRRRKLLRRLFATGQTPACDCQCVPSTGDEVDGLNRTADLLNGLHGGYL